MRRVSATVVLALVLWTIGPTPAQAQAQMLEEAEQSTDDGAP